MWKILLIKGTLGKGIQNCMYSMIIMIKNENEKTMEKRHSGSSDWSVLYFLLSFFPK